MAITIHELAVHRGLKTAEDGSYSGADIEAVGLALIGGCAGCGACIAAYNAYPSKRGFWCCADCIEDNGFETVEEASRDIFGEEPKAEEKPITVFTDRELATVLHALRVLQEVRGNEFLGGCWHHEKQRVEQGQMLTSCDHFEESKPLSNQEIDALCDRLGLAPEQPQEQEL